MAQRSVSSRFDRSSAMGSFSRQGLGSFSHGMGSFSIRGVGTSMEMGSMAGLIGSSFVATSGWFPETGSFLRDFPGGFLGPSASCDHGWMLSRGGKHRIGLGPAGPFLNKIAIRAGRLEILLENSALAGERTEEIMGWSCTLPRFYLCRVGTAHRDLAGRRGHPRMLRKGLLARLKSGLLIQNCRSRQDRYPSRIASHTRSPASQLSGAADTSGHPPYWE